VRAVFGASKDETRRLLPSFEARKDAHLAGERNYVHSGDDGVAGRYNVTRYSSFAIPKAKSNRLVMPRF
jgi:hypothetical protein